MTNPIFVNQARAAASSGDLKTAVAILREAIRQNPRDVDAWLALSEVVEKPEQAEECLFRVLSIDPDNPVARQKLTGEPLPGHEPGFAADDGAVQGPEVRTEAVQQPETSNGFYLEHSISDPSAQSAPEPAPPLAASGSPIPAAAPPVVTPLKPPPGQKPGAKKSAQKKRRGISKLEIFFLSIIGVLVLCLGAAGLATLGGSAALEPEPTPSPDEITAVIYENIRASNAMDRDAYMATIHSGSPDYSATMQGLEVAFSGEFTLSYRLSDVYIIEQGRNSAVVHFVLTTRRVGGSPNFRDNQVEGEMMLRTEDGAWKIYGQKVSNIDYLD